MALDETPAPISMSGSSTQRPASRGSTTSTTRISFNHPALVSISKFVQWNNADTSLIELQQSRGQSQLPIGCVNSSFHSCLPSSNFSLAISASSTRVDLNKGMALFLVENHALNLAIWFEDISQLIFGHKKGGTPPINKVRLKTLTAYVTERSNYIMYC